LDEPTQNETTFVVTAKTLRYPAAATAVLLAATGALGHDRDGIVDDLIWFRFLLSALTLIVLIVGIPRARDSAPNPAKRIWGAG
jgi:hypothetical protein